MENIKENLEKIKARIAEAAKRAGRSAAEITLVAVSKTMPIEDVEEAFSAGQTVFGENRVQELKEKYDHFEGKATFHQIGTLQTNKVKYLIGRASLIESVDSKELITEISRLATKKGVTQEILIQVNIGREPQKSGVMPESLYDILEFASKTAGVKVTGLMAIPPKCEKPDDVRPYFKKMYDLFIDIGTKNMDNIYMRVLSMGMTNDFEVAIEEGSTAVRVGTAIFGKRDYMI